ncbi:MAG TPA: putative sulfate exporter family transporter [Cellulomonas sp.]|nr:putative sulfate exporter family transporter [Cellulomonas sp.]
MIPPNLRVPAAPRAAPSASLPTPRPPRPPREGPVPRAQSLIPGALAAIAVSGVCLALTLAVPAAPALLVAIVLGVVARAAHAVPSSFEAGLAWAGRRVLRTGVVLLGLQLSARDVLALGPAELGVLGVTVATTFIATLWLGRRLRVGRTLTLLVATGFSICGAAAVAAMSPVADADDDDVATAVAAVTLYGSVAILVVPVVARAVGLDDRTAGLWAGMSVHEVAQVVAAAGAISAAALSVAVVAKLARVVLLAPLVTAVGVVRRRGGTGSRGAHVPVVPLFVVGFLFAVAVRTIGGVPEVAVPVVHAATTVALGAAMVALGTQVHVARLARSGRRAVLLGALATTVAMTVSLGGLLAVGAVG